MASIFMIVAAILITAGFRLISDSARQAKEKGFFVAQAEYVAQAGLADALAWFSRHTSNGGLVFGNINNNFLPGQTPTVNPVFTSVDDAFDPVNNTANAQASDTTNQKIGIVKDYPLDNAVTSLATFWAHYEVWEQDAPNFTPVNGSSYNPYAVHDVTGSRDTAHLTGDGYVWSVVCKGYVYKRLDFTTDIYGDFSAPYTQAPNTVVASAIVSTELRKLSLLLPQPTPNNTTSGALYVQNIRNQVTLASTETNLTGAVSAFGNYAAIGMTNP
jgi:hypothetical protein